MLTSKQTEHIRAAMHALEMLPSGAIGEYGATEGASEHFVNRLAERLEVSPMSRALDYRREWASMQGRDRTC